MTLHRASQAGQLPGDFARRVARRFGEAVETYDAHSHIQQLAAQRLIGLIATASLPPRPRVLELGCGTGYLTALLAQHLPGAHILATDLSTEMVAACRRRLPQLDHAVMDASRLATRGPFDLVCSNFAAQWFPDLATTFAGLYGCLAPGGCLVVNLLGEQTFSEWRAAHRHLGLVDNVLPFPSVEGCRAALPPGQGLRMTTEMHAVHPVSGLAFLRHLRAIGADTPAPGRRPVSAVQMRRLLHALGGQPTISYEIHYIHLSA